MIFKIVTLLFFVNAIMAMQTPAQILAQFACLEIIDDKDILDAIHGLNQSLLDPPKDKALQKNLNTALFRLAQAASGFDAKMLAEILIKAGANPDEKFNMNEILVVGGANGFKETLHSYKATAKSEATGQLKNYLDSLKK